MAASPSNLVHSWLYRTARRAVICGGVALLLTQFVLAQSAGRAKKPTGPRALGLIEVTPSGKMTLLPVVVMIDGEFYDASAYKADPVPFALDTDTVYEGVKTGVSQGLFTVTAAQHGETIWRGVGKWQSAEEIAGAEAKKKAAAARAEKAKAIQDSSDGPPVLHRRGDDSAASTTPTPASSSPSTSPATTSASDPDDPDGPPVLHRPSSDQSPSATTAPTATPAAGAPAPSTTASQTASPAATTPPAAQPQASAPPANDPNLPTLRRGKAAAVKEEAREAAAAPAESPMVKTPGASTTAKPAASVVTASATSSGVQYFPAISDANGPEPRPYAYSMKPEEEAKFRDKMLALAAVEVRARGKDLGLATTATTPASRPSATSTSTHVPPRRAAKPPDPTFSDVQLRVFDLSNNNEPVLVLSANAHLPQAKGVGAAGIQYVVTLVAREDIYGDLHKAFSNVTDTQHLDVLPRLELIDAVDADGDGRGELLFRQVSDSGKAFVLYRVIGDQLWPLFQGKIG
jgi:hypothetical protein